MLLSQLLTVFGILSLELSKLWLEGLHRLGGFKLLHGKGIHQRPHYDGEDDDGEPEIIQKIMGEQDEGVYHRLKDN